MPAFIAPSNQEILTVSTAYSVSVSAPADSSVDFYVNGSLLSAMTNAGGGVFTYSWTPASIASSVSVKATGNVTGDTPTYIVTVAEANLIATNMTTWTVSGCTITAAAGVTHPDGTGAVYEVKPTAAGTASRTFYRTVSPAPSVFSSGYEIWVGTKAGSPTNVLSFNNAVANTFYDFVTDMNECGNMYSAVVETRVVAGITWKRCQVQRLSTAPSAQATMFHYLCKTTNTNSYDITAGELASCGIYVCDPRWVGSTSLPFTPRQKMACYRDTAFVGTGERWYYKHPFVDTESNMAGGPGGLTIRVLKPTGWTKTGNYKVLYCLPALIDTTETSLGHATATQTMIDGDYHNTYNCVVVIPYDRNNFLWWGCKADGSANTHDFMAFVLRQWTIDLLGASPDRNKHVLLGYSKSAFAAHSLMLRHSDKFGYAAGWDSPLINAWPNNQTPDAFTTQAQFNLYDPIQLLPTKVSAIDDKRRILVMGYEVFESETNAFMTALNSYNVSYYLRLVDEGVHSWGTTTWVPVAVAELMKLSNISSFQVVQSGSDCIFV